jgi:hypothetical protein
VKRIRANGIRINGFKVIARRPTTKASADGYPQTWFYLIYTHDLVPGHGRHERGSTGAEEFDGFLGASR